MIEKSHYNKKTQTLGLETAQNGTLGECILWSEVLRAKKFYGYQFNSQFCIDRYIADFICRKLRWVVEVDGSSHRFKEKEDQERDKRLAELGYKTIRLTEKEVRMT